MWRSAIVIAGLLVGPATLASPAYATSPSDLDCGNFSSQAAAQQHLLADPGDPDGLDGDHDGKACETYPYPTESPKVTKPGPDPVRQPPGETLARTGPERIYGPLAAALLATGFALLGFTRYRGRHARA